MGSSISGMNTWSPNAGERAYECSMCGIQLVCEVVVGMEGGKYAFAKQAVSEQTYNVSCGVSGKDGANVGASMTTKAGDWLVTYLRKDGSKHMCTDCFKNAFPRDFAGVLLTAAGKAKVINSKYNWVEMQYGNMD